VLAAGRAPNEATAKAIFAHCREHMSPFARIRRIEFAELPKTISGKIRRVQLRDAEREKHSAPDAAPPGEFTDR
jgi:acetyl-CoA synthetase